MAASSVKDMIFYGALAYAAYHFFIKEKPSSRGKVAPMTVETDTKEVEAAAASAATAGAAAMALAEEEEDDDGLTVPVVDSGLVDMKLSGRELLGLQDGAGVLNPP